MAVKINTLQDIFEVITAENFDRFMTDFIKTFQYLAEVKEGLTEEQLKGLILSDYLWTDDGENKITIELYEKDASEKV